MSFNLSRNNFEGFKEGMIGRLTELKKETKEHPRTPVVPKKHRETELE